MSAPEAFASFQEKWLAAHPEQRLVGVFLPAAQRRCANAFGTLAHELSQAAFHVHDAQVAATKLAWWREELVNAGLGRARHPITQELFAHEAAREADPALWPALADGALQQLDRPGAGTLSALLDEFEPFFVAVARGERALLCGENGNVEANAALWTFSHLLHDLPRLTQGDAHLVLPLGLLARHELARADLAQATPRRNMLIKDFLDELTVEIDGALGVASQRTLGLRVRIRLDRARIARALEVTDPLAFLLAHPHAGRWKTLWTVWREARAGALR